MKVDGSAVRFETCPRVLNPDSTENEEENVNKTLKITISELRDLNRKMRFYVI